MSFGSLPVFCVGVNDGTGHLVHLLVRVLCPLLDKEIYLLSKVRRETVAMAGLVFG